MHGQEASATYGPSGYLKTNITKTKYFRWRNELDGIRKMSCRSFWSWFDVNRSTFDENVRENDIYISFPVTLTFDL